MTMPKSYSRKQTQAILFFALAVGLAGGYTAKAVEPKPEPVLFKGDTKYFQCVDTRSQETVFERDGVQEVANEGDQWLLQMPYGLESFIQSPGEYCVIKRSLQNNAP